MQQGKAPLGRSQGIAGLAIQFMQACAQPRQLPRPPTIPTSAASWTAFMAPLGSAINTCAWGATAES